MYKWYRVIQKACESKIFSWQIQKLPSNHRKLPSNKRNKLFPQFLVHLFLHFSLWIKREDKRHQLKTDVLLAKTHKEVLDVSFLFSRLDKAGLLLDVVILSISWSLLVKITFTKDPFDARSSHENFYWTPIWPVMLCTTNIWPVMLCTRVGFNCSLLWC